MLLNNHKISEFNKKDWPRDLLEIPEPPKKLYIRGIFPKEKFRLAVVGSRKFTNYGKDACKKLIEGLRGYPIVIVSGLALGIDSIAHESALEAQLKTIAVPGSGLDENVIYPRTNLMLTKRILEKGGSLISEYENEMRATVWSFPQRNRIMAGISNATLVIEANIKSGTLITARLALEYGREVMAVPGSIFSSNSEGPLNLIRNGATPIRCSEDILDAFGLKRKENKKIPLDDLSPNELKIVEFIGEEPSSRDEIAEALFIPAGKISETITMLELRGIVKESGGKVMLC